MKSPLLSLPGAVPAEGRDEGVAAHYGDLFREQRALADGTGLVDLSHRGVVTVTGSDRLAWLHLLLTQHVSELAPGQATEALILTANGHIEHALYLVDDGETVWAHVEPDTQGELVAYLESMKFFYQVEVADRTEDFAVVHLPAGSIEEVPEGVAVREAPHGRDVFLPRADLEQYAAEHGPVAGILAYEALRVEAHRPRLGFETDHRTIPHELGWIGTAVHLQKGCYRGQETVARVQNLGSRHAGWSSCTWTAAMCCCPVTGRRYGSPRTGRTAASSASSPRPPATTSWVRSHWRWSSGTWRWTRNCSPGTRLRPRRRSSSRRSSAVLGARVRLPAGLRSDLDEDGERAMVRERDPHVRSEPARLHMRSQRPQLRHHLVDQRFGDLAGCRGVPGGPAALPGVPVESELRNHQKRCIHVGAGLLTLQNADRPELAGELRRLLNGVPMGDSDQHTQSLADDFAHHRGPASVARAVGHRDARAVHPLYHCTHTDQPILG